MNLKKLRKLRSRILLLTDGVRLLYQDEDFYIDPVNENKFYVFFHDDKLVFNNVDDLLNDKFVNGNCIKDIIDDIYYY